jgi:hypothetical protein
MREDIMYREIIRHRYKRSTPWRRKKNGKCCLSISHADGSDSDES